MVQDSRVGVCRLCGVEVPARSTRGRLPRWCDDCRRQSGTVYNAEWRARTGAPEREREGRESAARERVWVCPCGASFTPHRDARHRKWCSDACRVRHQRDRTPEGRRRKTDQSNERNRVRRMGAGTPIEVRTCTECSVLFVVNMLVAGSTRKERCSKKCAMRFSARQAQAKPDYKTKKNERQNEKRKELQSVLRFVCIVCDAPFGSTKPTAKYCSVPCEATAKRRWSRRRRSKRTRRQTTPSERRMVFERDGWICRICGDPVNRSAKYPEWDSPVVDHIIPLARHGLHDESNWQTAHHYCNTVKGTQIGFEFAA